MYTNEDFCIRFKNNYKKIKIILDLHQHNRHGVGNIDLEIDDNSTNYLNIDYLDENNENKEKIESNLGKIDTNTDNISSYLGKIDTNTDNIASNLEKINDNKDDILSLQNSNVKALYNLDKIFIYDIEKGDQTVNKGNYYHIFEKEITYTFIKDSYLEIILKVLTEISNYVLIGFFQIL